MQLVTSKKGVCLQVRKQVVIEQTKVNEVNARPMRLHAWPLSLKVVACVLFIVALIFFNKSQSPLKSKEAREFERWLSDTEEILLSGRRESLATSLEDADLTQVEDTAEEKSELPNSPVVKLTIQFSDGTLKTFEVGEDSSTQQALRILQLIRETDIFSAEQSSEPAGKDPLLIVEVSDQHNRFIRSVRYSTISTNPSTGVLLKLFQLYSDPAKLSG
jgi:hypothetical protein